MHSHVDGKRPAEWGVKRIHRPLLDCSPVPCLQLLAAAAAATTTTTTKKRNELYTYLSWPMLANA
jgi:hypothetical protein